MKEDVCVVLDRARMFELIELTVNFLVELIYSSISPATPTSIVAAVVVANSVDHC